MKVLMVSWEYPPVVVGGLGRHVYNLATALAAAGHEIVVLSRRPTGTDPSTHPSTDEIAENVRVIAAAQDPHEFDFGTDMMAWTLAMGHSMVRAGLAIKDRRGRPWRPDIVHAHDWLVAHPAIALAESYHWFPRSTPLRPVGTRAGSPVRSVGRCMPSNPGSCTNQIRSSHVRRR
jgi:glycogen synthase